MTKNCVDCRHYLPYLSGRGNCRAHPPVPVATSGGVLELWPRVGDDDWCGEFAAKPEPKPSLPIF